MIDLYNNYDPDELRIIDIQFLGLKQNPWEFSRGARTERLYTDTNDSDKTKVKDYYTYTMKNGDRDIDSFQRHIEWYDNDENLFFTVTLDKPQNMRDIKAVNRDIRQGRIDYLEGAAEELRTQADSLPASPDSPTLTALIASGAFPVWVTDLATYTLFRDGLYTIADSIDTFFTVYETEITHYITRGTMEFEDRVNDETDPTMLGLFNTSVRAPDADFPNGLTVKESILYQLTGVIP